ncbi:MAG TPA: hypothetical protein VFN70_09100 [Burkholderiales bacterium]|nr:hypothetical protein [Burkholderiales bacterium]
MTAIVVAESVTQLGPEARGAVLVAGSHAGVIAARYAARAGARAVLFNDAGVGKDGAGIAGLAYLEALGMAAAAVAHHSARIGDGADTLARGIVSHANALAARCGVAPGMSGRDAAERLRAAPALHTAPPSCGEGRFRVHAAAGAREVWALDSVGQIEPADAGRVLVIGSHAALHGGRPESALTVDAHAAVFHDAGNGAAGVTRLPALAARGIPAVAVDGATARIGDGRSLWESGIVAHLNDPAARGGATRGMTAREFALQAAQS